MIYKEDWEEAQERFKAWWKGEIIDRVCIAVTAPRRKPIRDIKPLPIPPEIAKLGSNHWYTWALNPEYCANRAEINFANTYYGGEALPYQLASFGPDMSAAYLGVEPRFGENTTWFRNPVIDDWHNLPDFKYNPDNKWWQITRNLVNVLGEKGKDKFFVGTGCDMLSGLDTLVSLRGASRLLFDLVDHPEEVKGLTDKVTKLQIQWFEELYQITQNFQKGSVSWLGLWSEGRTYPVQCDFAHMLSPRMFEEFVLPFIGEFCQYLNNSIYHLDGKGQIAHLDMLLDIKELDGIQWSVPVVPPDPPHDDPIWYPYFKRIQKKGKLLYIGAKPENVERLISDLAPEGLYISTSCESEEEAKELLNKAKLWTERRLRKGKYGE